jgi:hypothetical protein
MPAKNRAKACTIWYTPPRMFFLPEGNMSGPRKGKAYQMPNGTIALKIPSPTKNRTWYATLQNFKTREEVLRGSLTSYYEIPSTLR